ncbi:MAG: glycine cleavage system protein R [Acidimicrobiales bacterium]
MARIAVAAIGPDRPGMVAALTGALMERGANLEDTAMTNLAGHFAMMLVVEVPSDRDPAALEAAVAAEVADLGLTVVVRPLAPEAVPGPPAASSWAVSVYGADRPGIVHRVTRLLAEHRANIADLSTRVVGPSDEPAYVMLLEVTLPPGGDADRLGAELEVLAEDLGVEIHLRPDDVETL